jgi:hypothetical protein
VGFRRLWGRLRGQVRGRACALVGRDGCEVRLCDPCVRVSRVFPSSPRCPGVLILNRRRFRMRGLFSGTLLREEVDGVVDLTQSPGGYLEACSATRPTQCPCSTGCSTPLRPSVRQHPRPDASISSCSVSPGRTLGGTRGCRLGMPLYRSRVIGSPHTLPRPRLGALVAVSSARYRLWYLRQHGNETWIRGL